MPTLLAGAGAVVLTIVQSNLVEEEQANVHTRVAEASEISSSIIFIIALTPIVICTEIRRKFIN